MQKIFITLLGTAILTVLALPAVAESPLLKLDDFAYGADLTSAKSEFRRFDFLPIMIKEMQRRDLGDVRVFDGNNELMPCLVRKKVRNIKTSKQILNISPYKLSGVTKGYILDRAAKHKQSLKSLHLRWRPGKAPNVLSVRFEHSADRKTWKILKDSEIVSNFEFSGNVLKQNVVDINNYTKRYIRLTFLDNKQVPVLASVIAYNTNKKLSDYVWMPAGQLQPYKDIPNTFSVSASKGIPPDLLKLSFGKLNSMLSGSLYTLATVDGKPKRKLVTNNFDSYALSRNNKVIKSKPIDVGNWQSAEWLITTDSIVNFTEDDMPGVMVAYPQYEVVFANYGVEPYTAVWSNRSAGKPVAGDIVERIKNSKLSWNDIDVVTPGAILDQAELTVLTESRQTPWLMIIIVLFIIISMTTAMFVYRRYRSS